MPKGKGDTRTPGERSRDGQMSGVMSRIELILMQVKHMEDSAATAREYKHAQNYEKIQRLLKDIRSDVLEEKKMVPVSNDDPGVGALYGRT